MKHTPLYHFDECPMTDEDIAITRDIARRMGSGYLAVNLTETDSVMRRDFWTSVHLADTRSGKYSLRRDCHGRLVPIALCI